MVVQRVTTVGTGERGGLGVMNAYDSDVIITQTKFALFSKIGVVSCLKTTAAAAAAANGAADRGDRRYKARGPPRRARRATPIGRRRARAPDRRRHLADNA